MVDNEFETWAIDFHHYQNKSFIAPAIYMIPTLKGQGNCQQESAMFASSYTYFLISHTKCTIASSWLERKGELRKGESFVSVMVKIYCPGSNSLSFQTTPFTLSPIVEGLENWPPGSDVAIFVSSYSFLRAILYVLLPLVGWKEKENWEKVKASFPQWWKSIAQVQIHCHFESSPIHNLPKCKKIGSHRRLTLQVAIVSYKPY